MEAPYSTHSESAEEGPSSVYSRVGPQKQSQQLDLGIDHSFLVLPFTIETYRYMIRLSTLFVKDC